MTPEQSKIVLKFADDIRPVQSHAVALLAQAKRDLVGLGMTGEQASRTLSSTMTALMKEL
jgi:hypothetical protein